MEKPYSQNLSQFRLCVSELCWILYFTSGWHPSMKTVQKLNCRSGHFFPIAEFLTNHTFSSLMVKRGNLNVGYYHKFINDGKMCAPLYRISECTFNIDIKDNQFWQVIHILLLKNENPLQKLLLLYKTRSFNFLKNLLAEMHSNIGIGLFLNHAWQNRWRHITGISV